MTRRMRKLSARGDESIATWDETTSPETLATIEQEFNDLTRKGYFAADITDGKNEIIKKFDPSADIVMIPKMQGG